MPTNEQTVRDQQYIAANTPAPGSRSLQRLVTGPPPTPDANSATLQQAIFQDQVIQSDYRTVGEAGDAQYAAFTERQRAGGSSTVLGMFIPPPPRSQFKDPLYSDSRGGQRGRNAGAPPTRPEEAANPILEAGAANPLRIDDRARERPKSLRNPDAVLETGLQIPV